MSDSEDDQQFYDARESELELANSSTETPPTDMPKSTADVCSSKTFLNLFEPVSDWPMESDSSGLPVPKENIEMNMAAFESLMRAHLEHVQPSTGVSKSQESTERSSPPHGTHKDVMVPPLRLEPEEDSSVSSATPRMLSDRSKSESDSSHSGSSGTPKRPFFKNFSKYKMKNLFNRQSMEAVAERECDDLPESIKISGPEKRNLNQRKEYSGLRLAQTFAAHTGACWTMKLSPDGRYLASGGQDTYVNVWLVSRDLFLAEEKSSPKEQQSAPTSPTLDGTTIHIPIDITDTSREVLESNITATKTEKEDRARDDPSGDGAWLQLVIDSTTPLQTYRDHIGDVIDIAWSSTQFLLSASIDKTVRLWHVSRPDCLMVCRHPDIVSGVAFDPLNDRYYLTGCLDKKLRVWDMETGTPMVAAWVQTPEMISAVSYCSNGSKAVAGLVNGLVFLYDATNKLKYDTQLSCRNRSGQYRFGCKVCGVEVIGGDVSSHISERSGVSAPTSLGSNRFDQLLLSTNDSRVRIFRLGDYSLSSKFKGHCTAKSNLPIRASASEGGQYVISGSEDGCVYIWNKTSGRRKVRTIDAYTDAINYDAHLSNFTSGMSTLRNSTFECFNNNNLAGTAKGGGEYKDKNLVVPVLCTSFGTSAMIKNILPPATIQALYISNLNRKKKRSSACDASNKSEGHVALSSPSIDLPAESRDDINLLPSGSSNKPIDQKALDKFVIELSRQIILTADYNGVIRVYIKGFS